MARMLRSRSVVAAVIAGLGIALVAGWLAVGSAAPAPNLPAVSPNELIASTLRAVADRTPVSGTVTTHVDLGLPQLPSGFNDPAGPAGVLLADQTFKEWFGPDGVRVAQILPFGERDLVANKTDVWFWDSSKYTAWHLAVPPTEQQPPPTPPSLGDLQGLVAKALGQIQPYAQVSVVDPEVIAGRDAYVLRLTPATTDTLVGRVEVAIDAKTRVPLRFQVFPRASSTPVIEAGFTSVDFGPGDPSMFTFTPPDGATVKQVADNYGPARQPGAASQDMPQVRTFGKGFGLILAVRVIQVPSELRPLFPYAGPLGSADLVERGDHAWVVVGLVPRSALAEVESQLP